MNRSILIAIAGIAVIGGLAGYSVLRDYGESQSTTTPPPATEKNESQNATTITNPTSPMPSQSAKENHSNRITLKTNMGTIQFTTYDADAPKAVENFVKLAGSGYYNGVIFHRVIKGFMIQGGDPYCTNGKGPCGTGGPGYQFGDELKEGTESASAGYRRGTVAMANAGPNTNGSQFFIMHQDYPLPHNYTIFGKVVAGQDIVDKIATTQTGAGDRPVSPVIIESTTVETIK